MTDPTTTYATRLLDRLTGIGRVAVAYSGGADSALVLAAAVRVLGAARVLAVTAVSPSLAAGELAPAARLAASLEVRHLTPQTDELAVPGYRANGRDRCYFCKSTVLGTIIALARERGFTTVATGTNADDAVDPFRPGIRAGAERGALTPLRDAGLTKAAVRAVSHEWGLATWDKPATPCLASRIRYGIPVTADRLARVDRAEQAVRAFLPVTDLRVRDLGDSVRVEVDTGHADPTAVADAVAAAGFPAGLPVEIGPYRTGSLNHVVGHPAS